MRVICIDENFNNPFNFKTPKLGDVDIVVKDGLCACGCGERIYTLERFEKNVGFPVQHFSPFDPEEEKELDKVESELVTF